MKCVKIFTALILSAGAAFLLSGCSASSHARNVELKKTVLVNADILEKGSGDQFLYRYEKPGINPKKYKKLIIDPVIVAKADSIDDENRENVQILANNAYVYLVAELGKYFEIVQKPGPGTLRLQFAIQDADSSKSFVNLVTSVMPIGIGLSIVKYSTTGKPIGVGEITVEARLIEADTGVLISAGVDRRVGGKAIKGVWDNWYNADDALQYWAKRSGYVVCTRQERQDCVEP